MGINNLTLINGNGQPYKRNIPKLIYIGDFTKHGIKHILENTGLNFVKKWNTYEAQPRNFKQITALFMTYNFKTEYHNNATNKNIIFLKGMYNTGFKVESICFKCCEKNGIYTGGLSKRGRLAC